jgi:hypothetical protein
LCQGGIQAHHAGDRGLGQRAHDRTAIPLCLLHHRCWHDGNGAFLGWDRERRRDWADDQIAKTQQRWHEMPAWF